MTKNWRFYLFHYFYLYIILIFRTFAEYLRKMNALSHIQQTLSDEIKRLNEEIVTTLHSSNPLMNEVIDNYLRTKGKQIRPILVILSAKTFGSVSTGVISAAAAVELLHNAYGNQIHVFDNYIPFSVRMKEAVREGQSIFKYEPKGKVAKAYMSFTEEVLEHGR